MKLIINARESHLDDGPIAIVIVAEFKKAILMIALVTLIGFFRLNSIAPQG